MCHRRYGWVRHRWHRPAGSRSARIRCTTAHIRSPRGSEYRSGCRTIFASVFNENPGRRSPPQQPIVVAPSTQSGCGVLIPHIFARPSLIARPWTRFLSGCCLAPDSGSPDWRETEEFTRPCDRSVLFRDVSQNELVQPHEVGESLIKSAEFRLRNITSDSNIVVNQQRSRVSQEPR